MTLRQLEIFLAVARERNFSRAAKRIHLSQPTLSEHIGELERELRTPLFHRGGREVTLTEAGQVLEPYARRSVSAAEEAHQAMRGLGGLDHGSLLIGASTTPGLYVMPRIVALFRARYPGVDLKLQIANSQVIEERVRDGRLDLGVVGGHPVTADKECLTAGLVDELVLIVPPGHPWAARAEIPPVQLAEHPLLVREEGSATRRVVERALGRARVRFAVAMELDHTEAIKQAVMAGLGIAFVSTCAVTEEMKAGRLREVRLRGLRIRRHFHVLQQQGRRVTTSARAFVQILEGGAALPTRATARRPSPNRSD